MGSVCTDTREQPPCSLTTLYPHTRTRPPHTPKQHTQTTAHFQKGMTALLEFASVSMQKNKVRRQACVCLVCCVCVVDGVLCALLTMAVVVVRDRPNPSSQPCPHTNTPTT